MLVVACQVRHDSSLVVREGVGGAGGAPPLSVQAKWSYRSGDVDIDASLATERVGGSCETVGRLLINKVLSPAERYSTDVLDCTDLELTATGDIRLYQLATGHDWSTEDLLVDRDREILSLGPWSPPEASGAYRVELSAPDCGRCACPQIVLRHTGEDVFLPLGRDCD